MLNLNPLKGRPFALTWLLVFALLHLGIVLFNHYYYRTFAYYYGVYNFAFFDFAHFRSSPCTVLFDGTNATFLQDHFSFLLPVLSPLYWLTGGLTGTYTLLIVQWIAVVYGGWSTYKLIDLKSNNSMLATVAMICYFTIYSRYASYLADCNLAIIGSALIPPFLFYFEKKKLAACFITFTLLLITREDFSLWLIFICLFLLIQHRREKDRLNLAALLTMVSAAFFVLLFAWVIPAFESEDKHFDLFNYAALGKNPQESLVFILSHPTEALSLLFVNHLGDPAFDWIKARFYIIFGLSGGFLLFWRPVYLICLIPIIAKKMYNDDPLRWGYESYYGIETASILPALVFMVIAEFKKPALRTTLAFGIMALTIAASVYCFRKIDYPLAFTKIEFYRSWFYQRDYPYAELNAALRKVPANAAVSASGRILPHVSLREKIYYFPRIDDAEYLCLSLFGDSWPISAEEYEAEIVKINKSGEWEVDFMKENVIIYRRIKTSLPQDTGKSGLN